MALDGPSGSGKGTVGLRCAEQLGWHYLDSGAIYRALAVVAGRCGLVAEADLDAILREARALELEFRVTPAEGVEVWINGESGGDSLRTEETGKVASRLAAIPAIRQVLLVKQRDCRRNPGLVADGRDMGTVVFPDATLKIFLTASAAERAKRRYNQLKLKGFDVNLAQLFRAIQDRDTRDSERGASPLMPAADAITLDTSGLVVNEVVARVLDLLSTRLAVTRVDGTSTN